MGIQIDETNNYFIENIVLLAYHFSSAEEDAMPLLQHIERSAYLHFLQELSLQTIMYDRFSTLGVSNEEEFARRAKAGGYDHYAPSQEEIRFYLESRSLTYVSEGEVWNCPLQGVW